MTEGIKYPTDDKLDSKFECALSHPTFLDGLNWLIVVEHERTLKNFIQTGNRETLYSYFVREFIRRWSDAGKPIDLVNEIKFPH